MHITPGGGLRKFSTRMRRPDFQLNTHLYGKIYTKLTHQYGKICLKTKILVVEEIFRAKLIENRHFSSKTA